MEKYVWLSIGLALLLGGLYYFKLRTDVITVKDTSKKGFKGYLYIGILLVVAFIVKVWFSTFYHGYPADITCFTTWSDWVYQSGIGKFYYLDGFTDYPPGYMYILYGLAWVRDIFNIESGSDTGVMLLKTIPILFDLGAGFILYKMAKERFSEISSLLLAGIYLVSPMVIINSSLWGQVDASHTFFVLLMCYMLTKKKLVPAYFIFAIGILVKPQTVVFAPVVVFAIVEQVFLKDFTWKKFVLNLSSGLAAIGMLFALAAPFGLEKVISQYRETMGSYPYASVNAYNFWTLLGKNWADQGGYFLFLKYVEWGSLAIIAAVVLGGMVVFFKRERPERYVLSAAVVMSTFFLFSVRMHERYWFPAVVLILAAYLLNPKKEYFAAFVAISALHFLNQADVLFSTMPTGRLLTVVSGLSIIAFGYMLYGCFKKEKEVVKHVESNKKKYRKR